MDLLQTAKDLIKKGNELNDQELISMGHDMLEKYSNEPKESVQLKLTEDIEPQGTIELKPELKTQSFTYICENCMKEFTFTKKRRKCPDCKKNQLKIKPAKESEGKKKFAKRQPLDVSKSKYNRFSDNGTLFNDPENEYLKTKPRALRTRKAYNPKHVTCTQCGKQEDINPFLASRSEYVCDKCLIRGSRV